MAVSTSSPPEQGQLVQVRQRRYVVTEVAQSALPNDPLRHARSQTAHLISLSSVEDDGLGEELEVIWELEPGAQTIRKWPSRTRPASTTPSDSTPSWMPSAGEPRRQQT